MEEAGYKQEKDLVGSCFDAKGHVTTIHPKELGENYEQIVKGHDEFVSKMESVSLKPISIKSGLPQFGNWLKQ